MKAKTKENKKKHQISADVDDETYAFFEKLRNEHGFTSMREILAFAAKGCQQSLNPTTKGMIQTTDKTTCEALSPDGKYCCFDLKETNPSKCKACMQRRELEEQFENSTSIRVRLEDKKSGYVEKLWKNLTGMRLDTGDFCQGMIKIQQQIVNKNSEIEWLKEELSTCPKCGHKIPLDLSDWETEAEDNNTQNGVSQ
jgi:hypothetical protein